jgi:hypothetical protein
MIPHPTDWSCKQHDDALVLHYRGDATLGFLRYVERLPLASAIDLLAMQLANDPQFVVDAITAPETLVTREGEYASVARVYGHLDGVSVCRELGWVFGDAHVSRISGMTTRPELRERFANTVHDLVLADEQHLGIRRRRFLHAPPAGWDAHTRGFATSVYSIAGGEIEVSPAMPYTGSREDVERQLKALEERSVTVEHRGPSEPIDTRGGLRGQMVEMACKQGSTRFVRRLATFVDDRYLYTLRLDSLDGRHRDAFDAVVRSAQPIPNGALRRTKTVTSAIVDAFGHWC